MARQKQQETQFNSDTVKIEADKRWEKHAMWSSSREKIKINEKSCSERVFYPWYFSSLDEQEDFLWQDKLYS
ncbi:MAG: hypothetical protein WA667_12715 [Candidatus Nitrosopolaris sp.]